jgi:penicillin-binding protein 1A
MVEAGFVRESEATAALREGTSFVGVARPGSFYFADWVAEQLADFAGSGTRDLTVTTTLDVRLQSRG